MVHSSAMSFGDGLRAVLRHRMRAYYVAFIGGLLLIVSAFLPWLYVGEERLGGVPDVAGLWILGLGGLAVVFSTLSVVTRRNSRHPLLLVGLAALAILFITQRLMARSVAQQAWAASQAIVIVHGVDAPVKTSTGTGAGIYVGVAGSLLITLFGLTIVVRRISRPYTEVVADDDV